MRLYLIVNRYCLGIQAGIQAAHVIPELYEKYRSEGIEDSQLCDWATDHKTVVVLRTLGGHDSVMSLYEALNNVAAPNAFPIAKFHEGELNDSATAVGILLPTEYYTTPKEFLSGSLLEIHSLIGNLPLAA